MSAPADQAALLAESAHAYIAKHPGRWQRVESRSCGGNHDPQGGNHLVVWRGRLDDYADPLDFANDWVVEAISPVLCVNRRWLHWIQLTEKMLPGFSCWSHDMPDDGKIPIGGQVRLSAKNGDWLWRVVDEPRPSCCGGRLARWPD